MVQQSRVTPRWHLSGPDLCRLMRRHRVTIRTLAQGMDIPMTRIRSRRLHGIQDWLILRDWVEAITGVDPGAVPHALRDRGREHA